MKLSTKVLIGAAVGIAAYVLYKKTFSGNIVSNPINEQTSTYQMLGKTYEAQPSPAWYFSSGENLSNVINPFSSLNPGRIAFNNLRTWLN